MDAVLRLGRVADIARDEMEMEMEMEVPVMDRLATRRSDVHPEVEAVRVGLVSEQVAPFAGHLQVGAELFGVQ